MRLWAFLAPVLVLAACGSPGVQTASTETGPTAPRGGEILLDEDFSRDEAPWHTGGDEWTTTRGDRGVFEVRVKRGATDTITYIGTSIDSGRAIAIDVDVKLVEASPGDRFGIGCGGDGTDAEGETVNDGYTLWVKAGKRPVLAIQRDDSWTPKELASRRFGPGVESGGNVHVHVVCRPTEATLHLGKGASLHARVKKAMPRFSNVTLNVYSLRGGARFAFDNLVVERLS